MYTWTYRYQYSEEKTLEDKLISKKDIIAAGIIVVSALLVLLFLTVTAKNGKTAVISYDGEDIISLKLSEDTVYRFEGSNGYNVIEIKDGRLSITEADCPDKICVKHKDIKNEGEVIICLPHKLVVEIEE